MDSDDFSTREARMEKLIILPDDCMTMKEVREGVDHVDSEIGRLLGQRFGYMRAAARIKPARDTIRDEERKAQVIGNARAHALAAGSPEERVADLYDQLVEHSIAYELEIFDLLKA